MTGVTSSSGFRINFPAAKAKWRSLSLRCDEPLCDVASMICRSILVSLQYWPMDDSHARKFQKDLNAGLVALVLLAVLDQTA